MYRYRLILFGILFVYFPVFFEVFATQDQQRSFRYVPNEKVSFGECLQRNLVADFYITTGRTLLLPGECMEPVLAGNISDLSVLRILSFFSLLGVIPILSILRNRFPDGRDPAAHLGLLITVFPGVSFMVLQGGTGIMVLVGMLAALAFTALFFADYLRFEFLVMGLFFWLHTYPAFILVSFSIPFWFIFFGNAPWDELRKRIFFYSAGILIALVSYFVSVLIFTKFFWRLPYDLPEREFRVSHVGDILSKFLDGFFSWRFLGFFGDGTEFLFLACIVFLVSGGLLVLYLDREQLLVRARESIEQGIAILFFGGLSLSAWLLSPVKHLEPRYVTAFLLLLVIPGIKVYYRLYALSGRGQKIAGPAGIVLVGLFLGFQARGIRSEIDIYKNEYSFSRVRIKEFMEQRQKFPNRILYLLPVVPYNCRELWGPERNSPTVRAGAFDLTNAVFRDLLPSGKRPVLRDCGVDPVCFRDSKDPEILILRARSGTVDVNLTQDDLVIDTDLLSRAAGCYSK